MSMTILAIIGFNKIVALFRQHNIGGGQNSVEFLVADDPTLFAFKTVQAAGKVTAVMHDADIIGIQVFGRPVQARQLAEICVALRDIVAGIIADIAAGRVDGMTHLYRQVHGVFRYPVRFMCCYDDRCLQSVFPACFLLLRMVSKKAQRVLLQPAKHRHTCKIAGGG